MKRIARTIGKLIIIVIVIGSFLVGVCYVCNNDYEEATKNNVECR